MTTFKHTLQVLMGAMCLAILALPAGCTTFGAVSDSLAEHADVTKAAVQFGTLKTIEDSDSLSATDIIDGVERLRDRAQADDSVTLIALRDEMREALGWQDMPLSDRLLVDALAAGIADALADIPRQAPLGEQHRLRVMTLLEWVEAAARYAAPA